MTVSVENFIKAIYNQTISHESDTRLSTIASTLKVSNAAATDMARKLAIRNLVNYQKYKPLTLTEEGLELAMNVIRKHRLWETFLHQTLQLSLHEIHEEAEHLEHQTSDFLAEKIDNYLGNPSIDPHGDPIPTVHLKIHTNPSHIMLSEAEEGLAYEITRLFSSEKDFFDFCAANHLTVGSKLTVDKQYKSNHMTAITVSNHKLVINDTFTKVIFVEPFIETNNSKK